MIPCTSCGAFVRRTDACPACGRSSLGVPRSAVAVLLGLAACTGDKATDSGHTGETPHSTHSTTPQPDYGVSYTYTDADTDADSDTDTDTDADTDTEPPHTGTTAGGSGGSGSSGSGGGTHTGFTTGLDYGIPPTTN
jgi:hypothetical protein